MVFNRTRSFGRMYQSHLFVGINTSYPQSFFPTSLCGVLVLDSAFRPSSRPSPVLLLPSFPQLVQTQLTTRNLLTHNLHTYNLITHDLLTHNLHTHNFLTYNLITHNLHIQLAHTQLALLITHNLLTHNLLTQNLLTHSGRRGTCVFFSVHGLLALPRSLSTFNRMLQRTTIGKLTMHGGQPEWEHKSALMVYLYKQAWHMRGRRGT